LAHSLRLTRLVNSLEDLLISDAYLNDLTAVQYLHEAIRFGNERLKEAAKAVIIEKFEDVIEWEANERRLKAEFGKKEEKKGAKKEEEKGAKKEEEKETYKVATLPIEEILEILKSDELKVNEEQTVVRIVTEYLTLREPLRPLLEEEDPSIDPKVIA
jgi:BTB And C-terminal Kelch